MAKGPRALHYIRRTYVRILWLNPLRVLRPGRPVLSPEVFAYGWDDGYPMTRNLHSWGILALTDRERKALAWQAVRARPKMVFNAARISCLGEEDLTPEDWRRFYAKPRRIPVMLHADYWALLPGQGTRTIPPEHREYLDKVDLDDDEVTLMLPLPEVRPDDWRVVAAVRGV